MKVSELVQRLENKGNGAGYCGKRKTDIGNQEEKTACRKLELTF